MSSYSSVTGANEVPRVRQWLMSRLAAVGAPGGVHSGIAPAGTLMPYLIIQHQGARDVAGVAGIRLWTTGIWQVKVVGLASAYDTITTLADALDLAIQRQRGGAGTDGIVVSCVRQQPLALDELLADGTTIMTHLGGLYQIEALVS